MNEHLNSGRTSQKLNTRSKILTAAHRVLEKGMDLSMENVAIEAKVSRATIYRYYSNVDSLSTELILHLNLPKTESMIAGVKKKETPKALLQIQDIFLDFILQNEIAARKFLGAVLSSSDPKLVRGKNRLTALQGYFKSKKTKLTSDELEKLIHISVLLMGIESVLVSKDVCGLNNKKTKETLQWGLEMILKGANI